MYSQRFDEVLPFHEPGLAPVRRGRWWWYVREDGSPAFLGRYNQAYGFYEGRAAVRRGRRWFHIRTDGSPAYRRSFAWCGNFQEGRAAVALRNGAYRHITLNGTFPYSETYAYAGDYREGAAVVVGRDGAMWHVDCDGRLVNKARFEDLGPFHKGVAPARDARGWFHVNRDGLPLYTDRFVAVEPFYNGRARAVGPDGSILVVDQGGRAIRTIRGFKPATILRASHDLVGYWKAKVVSQALRLRLFDLLPAGTSALTRSTSVPEHGLRLLLSALEERGYVRRGRDGRWSSTALGRTLRSSARNTPKDLALHWDDQMSPIWGRLGTALEQDRPGFLELHPEGWFAWLDRNPAERDIYQHAMQIYAQIDYPCLTEKIKLSDRAVIVDAGGGTGFLLESLLRAHPRARGYLLERPGVRHLVRIPKSLRRRMQAIGTDFFAPWPVRGDAVLLARVVHDWADGPAVNILRRARAALTPRGRIHVIERVLSPGAAGGGVMDLHLFLTNGGRERTVADFRALFRRAGLVLEEVRLAQPGLSVLSGGRAND